VRARGKRPRGQPPDRFNYLVAPQTNMDVPRGHISPAVLSHNLALLLLAALATSTGSPTLARAETPPIVCCCGLRPIDQLWLVSDRSLGCSTCCDLERMRYWRYDCQRHWTPASLDELLAAEDPQTTTIIFLHGNRIPAEEAFTKGWSAYRTLVRCAGDQPVRFIVWSWPSDKVHGPIKDARIKADRTNVTAFHVACLIDRLDPAVPLSLWGHSFGARAVTGALHLLGGGELCGRVLDQRVHPDRAPAHVVLLAAALDNYWLLPGRFHGQALSQTAQVLLINNSSDRLLMRYHLLYHRRASNQALGFTGINRAALGDDAWKVRQIDACSVVGKQHLLALYLGAPSLMAPVRTHLLSAPGIAADVQSADRPELAAAEPVTDSTPRP
jgi:hypothetical protein